MQPTCLMVSANQPMSSAHVAAEESAVEHARVEAPEQGGDPDWRRLRELRDERDRYRREGNKAMADEYALAFSRLHAALRERAAMEFWRAVHPRGRAS